MRRIVVRAATAAAMMSASARGEPRNLETNYRQQDKQARIALESGRPDIVEVLDCSEKLKRRAREALVERLGVQEVLRREEAAKIAELKRQAEELQMAWGAPLVASSAATASFPEFREIKPRKPRGERRRVTVAQIENAVRGRWIATRKARRNRAERLEAIAAWHESVARKRRRSEAKRRKIEGLEVLAEGFSAASTPTLEKILCESFRPSWTEVIDRRLERADKRRQRKALKKYVAWAGDKLSHEHGLPGERDNCPLCEQHLPPDKAFLEVLAGVIGGVLIVDEISRPGLKISAA